jgi:TonB family protein
MIKRLLADEKVVSVSGTVIFHGVLLVLFLLLTVDFRPVVEEFAEVTFSGGWLAPTRQPEPLPQQAPAEEAPAVEETSPPLPEEIELPERREMDLNEQEIIEKVQSEPEKIVTPGNIMKKIPETSPLLPATPATGQAFSRQEKQVEKGLFQKQLDEKLLQGTQKIQLDANREFEIDWEGEFQREVYQKRLPEFPPDVQREATIKIQFSVLPSGLVGSAMLLQKGDTRLENLTLEAFKTWRFNPLPDYLEQVNQNGVITFRFKLK